MSKSQIIIAVSAILIVVLSIGGYFTYSNFSKTSANNSQTLALNNIVNIAKNSDQTTTSIMENCNLDAKHLIKLDGDYDNIKLEKASYFWFDNKEFIIKK